MQMFLHPKSATTNRLNILESIGKLAIAGEQAGFTVEEMIQLLRDGLTVEILIDLITERLTLMGIVEPNLAPKEYRT